MNTINQSTDRKFKFGVAISYLIQDEDLALKINHLIQDQVKTFIFTERQIELAGRDGEVELIKIFSEQARIDVVLFRKEWGTTPWTRIEKNAIRRRGHGEGYDFTFFIVVDDKDDLPKWLPTTNIWWDLERYELLGAAVAILDKLKDQGGEVKVETASDLTMRLQRDHLVEKQRRAFLNSGKGVQAADELAVELFEMIVEAARESTETGAKSMKTALGQYRDWVRLEYSRYYLLVSWVSRCANSLRDAVLNLKVTESNPPDTNIIYETHFKVDQNAARKMVWKDEGATKPIFITNSIMCKECIKLFFRTIREAERERY